MRLVAIVSRNYTGPANWYQKAAEQGHAHAQLFLGWMINPGDKFDVGASGPSPAQRANWPKIAFWLAEAFDQGLGPVWDFFDNASDSGFTYSTPGVVRWEWDEIRDDTEYGVTTKPEQPGPRAHAIRAKGTPAEAERHYRGWSPR